MFYVYVLQSTKDKELYFGFSEDLQRRVKEHNSGVVPSTRDRKPFRLIYYEAYLVASDARRRERQIKLRAQAFTALKRRIQDSIT